MLYKITLTEAGGLTDAHIEELTKYFEPCNRGYIVNEQGDSGGNSHLEGVVEFDTNSTSNITQRIKRKYESIGIEVVPGITIRVKKITHLVGALIYASKEIKDKGKVIFLKGWEQSWIDKQVKDNVKNIPYKMLIKKGVRITQNTGGALMYEWCIANNCQVRSKLEYLEVVRQMSAKGFLFGNVRDIGLYADLGTHFGDGTAAYNKAESSLRFID